MRSSLTLLIIAVSVCCAQSQSSQVDAALATAKSGRTQVAIVQLQTIARDSTDKNVALRARAELARLYQRQGDWWSAIDQLQVLRQSVPDDAEYLYQLGTVYNALSRAAFDRMQTHAPASARTQQLVAEQFAVIGENDRAIKALQDAIKSAPRLEGSHLALAMLYLRMGRRQDALPEVDRELAIAPQSAAALALKQSLK